MLTATAKRPAFAVGVSGCCEEAGVCVCSAGAAHPTNNTNATSNSLFKPRIVGAGHSIDLVVSQVRDALREGGAYSP